MSSSAIFVLDLKGKVISFFVSLDKFQLAFCFAELGIDAV